MPTSQTGPIAWRPGVAKWGDDETGTHRDRRFTQALWRKSTPVLHLRRESKVQVDLGKGTIHPSHMKARLAYASRILAFMDKHVPSARAANMAIMNDASWYRIAELAGEERKPSKATISAIVAMAHMREEMARVISERVPGDMVVSRFVPAPDPEEEMV